ncbi:hypothetical protein [Streptomyces sp. NPDC002851]
MSVSVSAVVLMAVLVFLFIKKGGLNAGHALVCVLFGFFLADSDAAPTVQDAVRDVFGLIAKIDF